MKNKNNNNFLVSRRSFIGTAAAAAASASILPLSYQCKSTTRTASNAESTLPNSIFGGVQIGAITWSFSNPTQTLEQRVPGNVDALIKACIDAGVSSIELQAEAFGVEEYLGAPKNPSPPPPQRVLLPGELVTSNERGTSAAEQQAALQQTPEQLAAKAAQDKYAADLKAWRLSVPMIKYEELRKKFNDAGIDIHIFTIRSAGNSDEEREYAYKAAVAMGAKAVGGGNLLSDSYKTLVPLIEKYGLYLLFHNHSEYADPNINVDAILNYSQVCMLNLDIGHYVGSTGLNPCDFIEKYHNRIFSLHLKDKTLPDNKYLDKNLLNTNQVWGQGETPIIEVLQLVKNNKWPIFCDIELEYNIAAIAPWKTAVEEVKICVDYCRQALI